MRPLAELTRFNYYTNHGARRFCRVLAAMERTMPNKLETAVKTWARPRLERLGKLADVAPGSTGAGEGSSGKS